MATAKSLQINDKNILPAKVCLQISFIIVVLRSPSEVAEMCSVERKIAKEIGSTFGVRS